MCIRDSSSAKSKTTCEKISLKAASSLLPRKRLTVLSVSYTHLDVYKRQGVLLDSHGNYTLIARLVAQEMKVPFFDLQYLTEKLEISYGVEESKKLHLHFKPGENSFFPEGKVDDTHLSVFGATEISKIFVNELKIHKHSLAKYLK